MPEIITEPPTVPRSRTHSDDEDVRNPLEKPARGYEDARDKTRKYSMS